MLSNSPSDFSSEPPFSDSQQRSHRRRDVGRRVLFWYVLVAVVLVLGVMSLRKRSLSHDTKSLAAQPVQFVARPFAPSVAWSARPLNTIARCDVIVVGATPSGVAAALAASRRGAQVVVVEPREKAGGDIVYAMLNMFDVVARPGEASPTHGIFSEFFEQLGFACDIDKARRLFENALREQPNIRFFTGAQVTQIYQTQKRVIGLQISQRPRKDAPPQWQNIECSSVIDATNDADIAARAGAGFYLGREEINRDCAMQSAGLLFSVKGVNWKQVRAYVSGRRLADAAKFNLSDTDLALVKAQKHPKVIEAAPESRIVNHTEHKLEVQTRLGALQSPLATPAPKATQKVWVRLGGAMGDYAWERGDIIKPYKPHGENTLVLSINFGRQSDGSVVLNTINIVGVNGLNVASRQKARNEAIAEIPFLLAHLRQKMPGFAHATLGRIAPELYIRETRHIHAMYELKAEDVRTQKRFFDRIALVSYPLDLHPYHKADRNPFGPRRYFYTIPLRSLVPRDIDGIFLASRSLGATSAAAGSARVIPITMTCGEAVGAAAALCLEDQRSPHQLMTDYPLIDKIQKSLRASGVEVE